MKTVCKRSALSVFVLYWVSWILPIGYEDLIGYEGAEFAYDVFRDHLSNLIGVLQGNVPALPLEILQSTAGMLVGGVNFLFLLAFLFYLLHVRAAFVNGALCVTAMTYWGISNHVYIGWGYDLWLACGIALTWLAAGDYMRISRVRPAGMLICAGIWPAYLFCIALIVLTILDP